jgi:ATP synthase protein I
LPVVPVVGVAAFLAGWLTGGAGAAWSATIATVVVAVNFVAFALSIAWAARVSPTMLAIVALGGYLVRLIVYTLVLVGLNTLEWFSPLAFTLALIPAVIGLLVYEARLLSGRLQADLWTFDGAPT